MKLAAEASERDAARFRWQDSLGHPGLGPMWLVTEQVFGVQFGPEIMAVAGGYVPEAQFQAMRK